MAVYLFWGQEEYLIDKEIKRLKKELLNSSFSDMGYKVFNNPPFNQLLDCLQMPPSMFGNTLSIIHFGKYLSGTGISLDDKQLADIDYALSNLGSSINIIFVFKVPRDENKKPDSRKKIYKIISKYSLVKEFPQYRNYDKALASVISELAAEKDLKLNAGAAAAVIEQLGVNLSLINSELEKLKTAVYPANSASPADIKKHCASSEDIFALADLLITGNKNEIFKQYRKLADKRHYLEICAFLESSLQKFVFIKSNEKRISSKDIAAKLKMHEFVLQKTQEKLRRVTIERLIQIRENIMNAEYKIKSGQSALEDMVLESALLS